MNKIIENNVNDLLVQNNCKLAYITKFGAHLYGTNTENSDIDVRGLYWPDIKDLILEKKLNSLSYTTGDNKTKNNVNDFDIQMWSVNYWLSLVNKGDTNAIDLLFSMYSPSKLVDDNEVKKLLIDFYDKPIELIDLKNTTGYIQYAYLQAKKYGLRGSRIDILKKSKQFFQSKLTNENDKYNRIVQYFDELLEKYYEPSYLFEKVNNNDRCIYILGKGYHGSIKLEEAINRLDAEYNKYGERAILAEENKGVDWKAVSHAVRACYQMLELIDTEFLIYPLKAAPEILEIKLGHKDWLTEVEPLLAELLNKVKLKIENIKENDKVYENSQKIIFNYYDMFLR